MERRRVLVTGATGYIGGRLVPKLLEEGCDVTCLVRSADKLSNRPWFEDPSVRVVEGDVTEADTLADAFRDVDAAYYLIHSMVVAGSDYADRDERLARAFAAGAETAGVPRIIYLGGLGETGDDLSEHLQSRRDVESALESTSVPVTVLRAAMIIGSGSASYEILRYLVEHLPVMITPRWVTTRCQPIGIRSVLRYLVACLDVPETVGKKIDIGGSDVVSYRELMHATADARGLRRRWVIPVPILSPRLSSLWIHLVTPLDRNIARPLAEGLRNEVVCRDDTAHRLMPGPRFSAREAIELAEKAARRGVVESAWSDAGVMPGDPDWAGGKVYEDRRAVETKAGPESLFAAVCRLGGGHGWYGADWLWRIRGFLDRLVGGPGLRRGRRDPKRVRVGDALDFWRVVTARENELLELRAEMKLPGDALLGFRITPQGRGVARLEQVALFKPRGLLGILYWYAVLPFHGIVFRGMLRGIREAAEASERAPRDEALTTTA